MADLAYTIAGNVLDKLGSLAYQEVSLAWGMKDDLNKLKLITLALQEVLPDAETKQEERPTLKTWVVELKDTFHDAVDVLDEFECELLRRKVVKQYASFGRKVHRFFSHSNPIVYCFSVAHRVREIRERLDEIDKNMEKFQLIKIAPNVDQSVRETHSFVNLLDVIGRDCEKGEILDMVLKDQAQESDNQILVISIIGIGGLGKTTLIKSVYNDDKIGEKFDLKIWVCVSLDFNVSKIVKDILTDTTGNCNLSNLNQLQKSLTNTLKDKTFLLVLDDVWNEDFSKWRDLAELLSVGSKKSKIIVTTRNREVALIMGETKPYELKGLPEKESLSLFFKCAFGSEALVAEYPQLKQIGEEIVKKCGGVPLALKTLGSRLRQTTEAHKWKTVRDNKIWELERNQGHILPALRLSYNAIDKDEKDEVVQLFLSTCISTFKHLRVFDLSKLSIEVLPSSIGTMKQLRYLNLRENEKIKRLPNSICKLQSLQTLILDGCVELEEIPDDIGSLVSLRTLMLTTKQSFLCYGSLKSLRFLYINSCDNLKVLSNDSINCTTLRTLAIGDCAKLNLASEFSNKNVQLSLQTFVIFSLPETTDLPQWLEQAAKTLRNLRIEDCSKLTRFPEWLPKLISLEKLEIICCRNLLSLPDGMEGLTSLTHLVIENCNALKERCKREVGPDWHKIAHIPNLSIG
uniref:Uncharacterized protein n=1 Tax=Cannabis sativa TaxID=3483 RepID=A0A803P6S9_CANSA